MEIKPANRSFTWANNQENRIMARLDRIFVSTDWDKLFPLAMVKALCKEGSDHTPLVIDLGVNAVACKKRFRFEKWWLERPDFEDLVVKTWNLPCSETNPIDVWQFRIRSFRKDVRGWAANVVADMNRDKKILADEYNILDIESETRHLSKEEMDRMNYITRELDKLWALMRSKLGKGLGIEMC